MNLSKSHLSRTLSTALLATTLLLLVACNSGARGDSEAAQHIERGNTYAEQGQFRAAMIEMRNAIQKDPENTDAAQRLSEIMLTVGANQEASEMLQHLKSGDNRTLKLLLAEAYVNQSKHVSAREVLNTMDANAEEERLKYTTLVADVDRLARNWINSEAGYREALAIDPAYQPAIAGLTRVQLINGNTAAAMEDIAHWTQDHGDDAELLFLKANVHYQQNELEQASDALTDALGALRSSDIFLSQRRQILTLLSRTLTEQGLATEALVYNEILRNNTDETFQDATQAAIEAISEGDLDIARSTLESLLQSNPENPMVSMLLGAVIVQQGEVEAGSPLLTDNVDVETSPVPFIRLSTMAQVDQGQREQALARLDRALMARPSDPELLAMHGILALADPLRANEGVRSLNQALQSDPSRSRLRFALAQHYLSEGDTEQALDQLRSAFEQTPDDWPVTEFYLTTLVNNDRLEEAVAARETLAGDYSDDVYANFLIATVDYRNNQPGSAITRMERLVTEEPEWVQAQITLAQMQAAQGDTDAAIGTYLKAAELNPNNINLLREATQLYANNSDPDGLVSWLTDLANATTALRHNALTLAAQVRMQEGQLSAARALMADLDPNTHDFTRTVSAQIARAEAQTAAQAQDWSAARTSAAEAISLQPENINIRLLLVRIEAAAGDTEAAFELLANLEAEQPDNPQAALMRASVIAASGENVQTAYASLRDYWDSYANPAVMLDLLNLAANVSPKDIVPLAQSWTETQPTNTTAWRILGDRRLQGGDEIGAATAYREVLALQPSNVNALNNLAWSLRESNTQEAVDLAAKAAELEPENPAILDTYGWVLHLDGRQESALAQLERAAELAPDNTDIQDHLDTVRGAQ